jgi:hypothetical protein
MAHPDLEALLAAVLPRARQGLEEHGEFHPLGAAMDQSGQVALVGPSAGATTDEPVVLLEALRAGLRDRALSGDIRAAVVCFDAKVVLPGTRRKQDAVCIHLEHESGECVAVFLPYRKRFFAGIKYGPLLANHLQPHVFAPDAED